MFAATIGLVQNDIKKVLAYSTVSQLGYMFLAAGVGAYVVAIFHVVTHAFFKACLFLGSGSVIHGMHSLHVITSYSIHYTKLYDDMARFSEVASAWKSTITAAACSFISGNAWSIQRKGQSYCPMKTLPIRETTT